MSQLRNRRFQEQVSAYAILGGTIGVMLAAIWPSLSNSGFLAGWDAGGHLLKAYFFAHTLLPSGLLNGWFPNWHGGFELFQFYPPLLYYLLGPLTLVFPAELALRIFTAALWIGLVPVTYYFLRSFKLPRFFAALGTTLLLALNASFGLGLGALYGVGLLPNGLGFIMAIWALGRMQRELDDPDRGRRQLIMTGLISGGLILSHTFSAYWWALASLTLLASHAIANQNPSRIIKRYLTIVLIALAVSAYWWAPLLMTESFRGATGSLQQQSFGELLKGLVLAEDFGGITISLLALIGLGSMALHRKWRLFGFFAGTLLFSLLLSLNIINAALPFSSVVASSQFIRFHAFFAWLMMILAAYGIYEIWVIARRYASFGVVAPVYTAAVVSLLFLVVFPTLDEKRGFVRVVPDNSLTGEIREVNNFLRENMRPGEFILSEFNWDSRIPLGSPHFANQRLPLLNENIWDLDGNFPEGTKAAEGPVTTASALTQTLYLREQLPQLRQRGVRYIVTTNPRTANELAYMPDLSPVFSGKQFAIFDLGESVQPFGFSAGYVPLSATYTPNKYVIEFPKGTIMTSDQSLAISYHPWLRAKADGRSLATRESSLATLQLSAPGEVSKLEISYRPPWYLAIPNVISLLAILACFVVILLPRRHRSNVKDRLRSQKARRKPR